MSLIKIPSIEAARKFFVAFCEKGNITVEWNKRVTVPHAIWDKHRKRGRIVLDVPALHTFGDWLFKAHHEAGHLLEEVIFTYDVLPMCKRHVERDVANIIADYLDEYNRLGEFPGHDRILWEGRRDLMEATKHEWVKVHPGIGAFLEWDIRDRREWQGFLPEMDQHKDWPVYLARFDELGLETRIPELLVTRSPEDMYALVEMIVEMIMAPLTEEEREKLKKPKPEGKPGGKSDKSGGKTVGEDSEDYTPEVDKESDGMGSGSGEEADGETTGTDTDEPTKEPEETGGGGGTEDSEEEGESEEKPEEKTPDDYEKSELPDTHKDLEEEVPKESSHGSEWYKPFTKHHYIVPDYRVHRDAREYIERALKGSTVSKRVKRYLKIISKDSFTYGHKTGKLHTKNIHRIYTGQQEPRIFKKKDRAILKTDSAIGILLDCSGSMSGSRYYIGSACCIAISQTLTDLRIAHEVAGFSETHSLWTYMFKRYDQNMSREKLLNGFASYNINLSQNADGESVLAAAERLLERKERHKLLIVLSDGSPAGTYTGNGNWYLRQVCKTIEESGQMDLLGIGIQTDAVERFYKHHQVVNKIQDLDEVLFTHLKRQLS